MRRIVPTPRPAPMRYLELEQLTTVIHYAHGVNDAAALAGFVFGGLAGLRLSEICALTPAAVREDTLTVGDKTPWSLRSIPVCAAVALFAAAWFTCHAQSPCRRFDSMSHRMRRVLNAVAALTGDTTYRMVEPHEAARRSFVNIAVSAGVEHNILAAYIGHAPQDTMSKHYADYQPHPEDMPRVLNRKQETMWAKVIKPIEIIFSPVSFFACKG